MITLLEGESLFNDGTAVVTFGIITGLAFGTANLTASSFVLQLLTVIGIGIGVGVLIGFGISYFTQRIELPQVEQSLTLVAAYGSYIIADDLGGSGVLGVVTTGLILGNFGSRIGMNSRTRVIVEEFWNFLAFLVNSIVFLVIGDQIRFNLLWINVGAIAITVTVMLLARAIAVYGLSFLSNRFTTFNIQRKNQVVLWWSGLRGSVTIALALSVPPQISDRSMIISIVFGVVLFTLLVQGLTIGSLVQRMRLLNNQQEIQQHYQEVVIRQIALNRVLERLQAIQQRLSLAPEIYRTQAADIQAELAYLHNELTRLQHQHPELREIAADQLRAELALTELETYTEFVRQGRLDQVLSPFLKRPSKD